MATLNLQVNTSTDDARNIAGNRTFNSNNSTYRMGNDAGTDTYDGFRFVGNLSGAIDLSVLAGATISSAQLDLYSAQTGAGTTANVILWGDKSVSSPTFSSTTAGNPEGRTHTTATTTDSINVATFNASSSFGNHLIDVTSIVQELVNQAGWVNGSAITIIGHDNGSATSNNIGYACIEASGGAKGAQLYITYTTGGGSSISKVSSVAEASISKVSGVAIASISKVAGVAK